MTARHPSTCKNAVVEDQHDSQERSTLQVNATGLLFDVDDLVVARPRQAVPRPVVTASDETVTPVAGVALWGPLLDRLGLVDEADRRGLRPMLGHGAHSGGVCYRALVETLLAGGDFLADRALLAGEATQALRGEHALPSHTTLWRFCAGADLGRAAKAAAVNRVMVRRAWAAGAAPPPGRLTIDPDATVVETYGPGKQGSRFAYTYQVGLHPLVGVCGETGEVLAVRARGGNANPGRALSSFIDECAAAIPTGARDRYQLWVRVDSAGYQAEVVEAAERHQATFSITAKQYPNVNAAIHALASDPATVWQDAAGAEGERGLQVAETGFTFAGRQVRLLVRRQPTQAGEQLSLDDLDGFRFQAIITNATPALSAVQVEHHHRLRGGIPEDAIRQLKEDFGFAHAPLASFGNWLWWQASALAYNTARWLRALALPAAFARCRGKRLRLGFLNVAARVTRSGRRLGLRLHKGYAHTSAFTAAVACVHALPAFG
jgi:hypothetical protein